MTTKISFKYLNKLTAFILFTGFFLHHVKKTFQKPLLTDKQEMQLQNRRPTITHQDVLDLITRKEIFF